jgi:hypothetical protein
MNNLEKYIEHSSGLYCFLAWIEKESDNGMPYEISNQIIYLDPLLSRYFSLGISQTKKDKKDPFLAIQPLESQWFSLIKWTNIALKDNDPYIYFIANTVLGDQENFPDIPCFAIGLYIDTTEKKALLSTIKNLVGREYFMDETKTIHINFHKNIFKLPVNRYDNEQSIIPKDEFIDYSKIISMKELGVQNNYSQRPDFVGDIAKVEGTEGLIKKWKENKV